MIVSLENLKPACSTIINAIDSSANNDISDLLELSIGSDGILRMSITNGKYYVSVKILEGFSQPFKATINGKLFLKLVAQTSVDDIDISINDNTLIFKGNGTYKIPLIYENENLKEIPKIIIDNVTQSFNIDTAILHSILNNNSKELKRGVIMHPIQKMYYVDNHGAITFTSGACVNNFELDGPVKLLFDGKLVKLFKLFSDDTTKFTLGFDTLSNDITQTKIKLEDSNIELSAILSSDDSLLAKVPADLIRNTAKTIYPYSVSLHKNSLLETISRLLLFCDNKKFAKFEFKNNLIVSELQTNNSECIEYSSSSQTIDYTAILNIEDFKSLLENCTEDYINLSFGDSRSMVLSRNNITNIIPEVVKN